MNIYILIILITECIAFLFMLVTEAFFGANWRGLWIGLGTFIIITFKVIDEWETK